MSCLKCLSEVIYHRVFQTSQKLPLHYRLFRLSQNKFSQNSKISICKQFTSALCVLYPFVFLNRPNMEELSNFTYYFCHTRQTTFTNCLVDQFVWRIFCQNNFTLSATQFRFLIMDIQIKKNSGYGLKARTYLRYLQFEVKRQHVRRCSWVRLFFFPSLMKKITGMWAKPNSNIICFTMFNVGVTLTFNCESC